MLRSLSVSLLIEVFCEKIKRDLRLLKVDRFSFRNANIYGKDLQTFFVYDHTTGKGPLLVRSPESKPVGEDSTWMVDRLGIPRIVDCSFYNMIELLWQFQKTSCVLSSARENQIVVTIAFPTGTKLRFREKKIFCG